MVPMFKILFTLAVGLFFNKLRSHNAFLFGLIEVVLAIGLTFLTFVPTQDVLLVVGPPFWAPSVSEAVGALAAIYVIRSETPR